VLVQRAVPDLRRVGLGIEPEADVAPRLGAELNQAGIVGGPGDRLVQRMVGQAGLVPVGSARVVGDGGADQRDVAVAARSAA
jgi:hypothetical protein